MQNIFFSLLLFPARLINAGMWLGVEEVCVSKANSEPEDKDINAGMWLVCRYEQVYGEEQKGRGCMGRGEE